MQENVASCWPKVSCGNGSEIHVGQEPLVGQIPILETRLMQNLWWSPIAKASWWTMQYAGQKLETKPYVYSRLLIPVCSHMSRLMTPIFQTRLIFFVRLEIGLECVRKHFIWNCKSLSFGFLFRLIHSCWFCAVDLIFEASPLKKKSIGVRPGECSGNSFVPQDLVILLPLFHIPCT